MGKSISSTTTTATAATKIVDRLKLNNNNNNTRRFQANPIPIRMETSTTTTTMGARDNNVGPSSSSSATPIITTTTTTTTTSSTGGSGSGSGRVPLGDVVSDCVKRWFKDTLKEAKSGDINMQVLLGQMYYSGYGVSRDPQKGRMWITRASRTRSTVWKVSDKRPGYNASDSDSDELKADS